MRTLRGTMLLLFAPKRRGSKEIRTLFLTKRWYFWRVPCIRNVLCVCVCVCMYVCINIYICIYDNTNTNNNNNTNTETNTNITNANATQDTNNHNSCFLTACLNDAKACFPSPFGGRGLQQ